MIEHECLKLTLDDEPASVDDHPIVWPRQQGTIETSNRYEYLSS